MKKLILLSLAIVLFTSCQEKAAKRYTQKSPEIEVLKSVIKDYNTKNWEALLSHYADTSKTFFNTVDKPISSKKIADYHTQNDVNYSQRGFIDEGQEYEMVLTDDGKTWVNFWGTWKGTLIGNNKEITLAVHLTAQFIDNKIVQDHGYWDASEVVLSLQEIEAAKNMIQEVEEE